MILGLPKRYAQKVVKKWSPPKREPPKRYAPKVVKKWSPPKREPAQEEPKLSKIPPGGRFAAPRECFGEFWVLLGPAPFLAVTIF